jgi:hypothetical protein
MYKPAFVYAHQASKSTLPIDTWCEVVGKKLPQFQSEEDIYSPVPIYVKIAGGINQPNGTIKLSVSPTNKDWYKNLVGALSEITKVKNLSVVNMEGKCISSYNTRALMCVGECDLLNERGKPVRLEHVVAPPLKLSTNKISELKEWWDVNGEKLAKSVAQHMKGLSMAEIAAATTINGPVHQIIEQHIKHNTLHNMDWETFADTYGNSRTSLAHISQKLLGAVRTALQANEHQVRNYHATEGIGSEASLWKRDTGSAAKQPGALKSRYKDDFTLYRDIVEDAMYNPLVKQEMVQSILYGTKPAATIDCGSCGGASKGKKKKEKKPFTNANERIESEIHPLQLYYQKHHYLIHGKLPGHVIHQYNKNLGNSVDKTFPGDASKTIDLFNLYTARAVEPIGNDNKKKWFGRSKKTKTGSPKTKRRSWSPFRRRSKSPKKEGEPKRSRSKELIDKLKAGGKKAAGAVKRGLRRSKEKLRELRERSRSRSRERRERSRSRSGSSSPRSKSPSPKKNVRRTANGKVYTKDNVMYFEHKDGRIYKENKDGVTTFDDIPGVKFARIKSQAIGEKIDSRMPRLIPIGEEVDSGRDVSRMPRLIPIGEQVNSRMPRLIPIGGEVNSGRDVSRMPRLIPIGDDIDDHEFAVEAPSYESLSKPVWDDDLPNLADLLKKK